MVGCF
ncbi:Protein of unknown function [Bacillus wiedmannii]